jgi:2-polyprenyl-3-methyl-5-hydroxy-6-metoxy-1,4-benzoquinol methylase
MESDDLRRSWIANAPAWCDAVRQRRIESRRLVTDAAIVSSILEQSPKRVLDIGCGEGWLARELASHGIEVVGIDASHPLVESARKLGGADYRELTYDAIIEDGSLVGSGFDTIVANFSLLDDRVPELLHALLPALSASGRLIVQSVHPELAGGEDPGVDGWRVERFDAIPGQWVESMPWYFRTLDSWRRTFETAGYVIEETREPVHPVRRTPASILWICRRAAD